jgi:hypothetical protein
MASASNAAIEDQPRDNKQNLPTVARYYFLFAGVLVLINGLVFIGSNFNALSGCNSASNSCVGPALFWGESFIGDQNGAFVLKDISPCWFISQVSYTPLACVFEDNLNVIIKTIPYYLTEVCTFPRERGYSGSRTRRFSGKIR